MPVITHAEAYLVDLAVETVRTDALQTFVKQETIFVRIGTDDGGEGLGYSYTIGTGGTAVLALLRDTLLARLPGQDPHRVEAVWRDLFLTTKATTVGPITSLALAAVDTALWDWRCRAAGQPLWVLAGGAKDQIPLYDTEGGWLHLSTEQLVTGARASQAAGWPGIKMKLGRSPAQDAERLGAVRAAVGADFDVMLDANQSLTAADAIRRARLLEPYDPFWFEEPLPAEDVAGHEQVAAATSIPIAVGESLYAAGQFAEYVRRGAAGVIQVDVARVGGITPWLKVAHLAEAANLTVCPHFLMELHVSLCCAVPNSRYLEHIPQLRTITHDEITVVEGHALAPSAPGLGIAWDHDAIDDRRVQ
ncbi:mandelate racemase/muconate lactonizing enzyme family protein [Actinoplanes awajinensis]|uniref:Mandelate racemase n=1 Tax=Actinoplanes awajinensis subsp. mycoplanecinus TaxID=135947 RepID=A0A101JU16_9ACTN|nr:mandelate racemase/muconate lactonizing enzyme family protein [Actinoplanes awajinensis]KUL32974.1 mandelate racemase [Actinoplanes awajinensis subsp. mycoplanecinus]